MDSKTHRGCFSMEMHARRHGNCVITWTGLDAETHRGGCSCSEFELLVMAKWICLFPACTEQEEEVFLLLMDFAVVRFLFLYPHGAGRALLCDAFSSYTIFITGHWPSHGWNLILFWSFLPLANISKKKTTRTSLRLDETTCKDIHLCCGRETVHQTES